MMRGTALLFERKVLKTNGVGKKVNSQEFTGLVSHLTMAMQILVRQPQRLDHFPAVRQEAH